MFGIVRNHVNAEKNRLLSPESARNPPTLTVIPEESFRRRLDRLAESDRLIRRLMDVFVERIRTLAQSQ